MLQQTTVKAVIPYYEKWIRRFPTVSALARASLQQVLRTWQGLGYYQRAKNLSKASRILVRHHEGRIPDDYAELRKLPGFGPYTTAAVLSLAFGRSYPVLDANVRRVLMRLLGLEGKADGRTDNELFKALTTLFSPENPGFFNQAMMELGALVCRSRNPQCLLCPVIDFCRAVREGKQEIIPAPKRISLTRLEAVVAVIRKEGRYLLQKRAPRGLLADLWEFPGGKIEAGETPQAALKREVLEETGGEVGRIRFLTTVRHAYTQFQVTLHVYACEMKSPLSSPGKAYRWVTLESIRRYPLPSGSVKIVHFLKNAEKKPESKKRRESA